MANEVNTATQPAAQAVNAGVATPATQQPTAVQTDIEKLDADIARFKADGSGIYDTAVQALEDEKTALIVKAEEEAKAAETGVENVATGIVTIEKTFREKYGNEILNGVEIVALVAIIYRLFIF